MTAGHGMRAGGLDGLWWFGDIISLIAGVDPIARLRAATSADDVLSILRAGNMGSVAQLIRTQFYEIPPALAQRGDIVLRDDADDPAAAPYIVFGSVAARLGADGLCIEPVLDAKQAFAV